MDRLTLRLAVFFLTPFALTTSYATELANDNSAVLERLTRLEADLAAMQQPSQQPATGEDYFTTTSSGGFFGSAELTLLAPQVGTLAASGQILGTTLGTTQITPKYGSFAAARLTGGYRNAQGLGMRLRYWDYNARARGELFSANFDTTQQVLAIDGEVTQMLQVGMYELDVSLGLRWGQIARKAIFPDAFISQDFGGLGPTAALWARRPLGSSNFALVGGSRVSMLFGDNDYTVGVDPSITDLRFTLTSQHAAVMVYELQGGVEWSRITANDSRLFVRVQGEAQVWQIPPALFGLLANTTGLVGVSGAIGLDW
jgi:hypothetical protein